MCVQSSWSVCRRGWRRESRRCATSFSSWPLNTRWTSDDCRPHTTNRSSEYEQVSCSAASRPSRGLDLVVVFIQSTETRNHSYFIFVEDVNFSHSFSFSRRNCVVIYSSMFSLKFFHRNTVDFEHSKHFRHFHYRCGKKLVSSGLFLRSRLPPTHDFVNMFITLS